MFSLKKLAFDCSKSCYLRISLNGAEISLFTALHLAFLRIFLLQDIWGKPNWSEKSGYEDKHIPGGQTRAKREKFKGPATKKDNLHKIFDIFAST